MALSILQQITAALVTRAQAIRIASGYETEAGSRVVVARPALDDSDLPCVVIWPEETVLVERYVGGTRARWTRRYVFEAVAASDRDDGVTVCEQLQADLHKAILGPVDETIGGLVCAINVDELRIQKRDDGGRTAGASITLRLEYFGGYGNPYDVS